MASNVQQGTRGLSAGDITRLKRLRGARSFITDVTTNPNPRTEVETGRRIYTQFGTSKIRNPASFYTDYRASQTADFVIESINSTNLVGKDLTQIWVCDCNRTPIDVLKGSNGICRSCTHNRIQYTGSLAQQPTCVVNCVKRIKG